MFVSFWYYSLMTLDSISARFGIMLNDAGNMIEKIYCNLHNTYKNIILDEYVVMPNHFHGIIQMQRADMESNVIKLY
jgi:REP element-mobilizing transposase RayT